MKKITITIDDMQCEEMNVPDFTDTVPVEPLCQECVDETLSTGKEPRKEETSESPKKWRRMLLERLAESTLNMGLCDCCGNDFHDCSCETTQWEINELEAKLSRYKEALENIAGKTNHFCGLESTGKEKCGACVARTALAEEENPYECEVCKKCSVTIADTGKCPFPHNAPQEEKCKCGIQKNCGKYCDCKCHDLEDQQKPQEWKCEHGKEEDCIQCESGCQTITVEVDSNGVHLAGKDKPSSIWEEMDNTFGDMLVCKGKVCKLGEHPTFTSGLGIANEDVKSFFRTKINEILTRVEHRGFIPAYGYESEEEKGFQKGIQAQEQLCNAIVATIKKELL